jgi:hypothetical protein
LLSNHHFYHLPGKEECITTVKVTATEHNHAHPSCDLTLWIEIYSKRMWVVALIYSGLGEENCKVLAKNCNTSSGS